MLVANILNKVNETLPDLASSALTLLQQERVERRQKLQEKKRLESRPLTLSMENVLPPVAPAVSSWIERDYVPAAPAVSPAPLTRTHSRIMNSYADITHVNK